MLRITNAGSDLLYSISDAAMAGIFDGPVDYGSVLSSFDRRQESSRISPSVFAQGTTHSQTSFGQLACYLPSFPVLAALDEL